MAARANPGAVTLGQVCASGMVKLSVACLRCNRQGLYRVTRLIDRHGAGKSLPELRHVFAADCPKQKANRIYDQCGVYYPDATSWAQQQRGREGG